MRNQSNRVALLPLLALALSSLSACVDEKIVYQDRTLFEEVPSAAADFVGYTDHDTKLTVCGNCHVEKQNAWKETVHATAWEDLQASGHATAACEGCHTVNELGNASTGAAGYTATQDVRYEDVQCEACHGPGLNHVSSPTQGNIPLASLAVGTDLTSGCGECHQGAHHPFVEEWSQSAHAKLEDHMATNSSCQPCHTGDGALRAWGIDNDFVEKQDSAGQIPITCGVCHDPHGSPNTAQLRFPITATTVDENLCMKCHQRNSVPNPANTSRGPHSAQGPTLLGEAGWFPPGMEAGKLVGTHGTPEANPRLCAGCHVFSFATTDEATGEAFTATGHVFSAIPCLVNGLPTPGVDCDDSQRTFKACTGSGCHANEDVARSARSTVNSRRDLLVGELNALLAQVPAAEFAATDGILTVAEGAKFDVGIAEGGAPVHNPFLVESLLIGSINEVRRTYGLSAQTKVDLTPMFTLDGAH